MTIPMQKIIDSDIEKYGVNLFVLRLDLIHPTISGNKWHKLKYNLEEAKKQKKETLLTFGGAYSNHITAVASAGKKFGFKTIGIIRGDELNEDENKTLRFAKECGMELHFISREEYRKKDAALHWEVKTVPFKLYSSNISIEATDLFVRIMQFDQPQAIIIESVEFVKTIREIFEMVWKTTIKTTTTY